MQKTTFPVRVCIHDDASTDKTAEIVREYQEKYPNLIWAYYQAENTFRHPNRKEMRSEFMRWAEEGKYQAVCEGDDYWIDENKIKQQFDLMESNTNISVCGTKWMICRENGTEIAESKWTPNLQSFKYRDVLNGKVPFRTCTLMYRVSDKNSVYPVKGIKKGDKRMVMSLLENGKMGYNFESITAVYRIHKGGIWSMKDPLDNLYSSYNLFNNYEKTVIPQYHGDAKKLLGRMSAFILVMRLKRGLWKDSFEYLIKVRYFRPNIEQVRKLIYTIIN